LFLVEEGAAMIVASTRGALAHEDAPLGEQRVDLGEDRFGKIVGFEQVAEGKQCRRIGHALAARVDARKRARGRTVIEGVFERFVSQGVPELQKVHPQHLLHSHRRAALFALGIKRLDGCHQPCPRHQALHLKEETLAARLLFLARVLCPRKTGLLFHALKTTRLTAGLQGLNQRFLRQGIAFHHGALPRHLSSAIVDAFNNRTVRYLFCTSTLIEGVNTNAENIILFDKKVVIT
jgi:hypothetical protein